MQINNQVSNQNFGMSLKITTGARNYLRNRRLTDKEVDKLGKLIDKFENKNVNVRFQMVDNVFSGSVHVDSKYSKDFEESLFGRLFRSPMKFIEKVCKKADDADNMYNHSKLDEMLDSKFKPKDDYFVKSK